MNVFYRELVCHTSPSILVYEENHLYGELVSDGDSGVGLGGGGRKTAPRRQRWRLPGTPELSENFYTSGSYESSQSNAGYTLVE